MHHEWLTLSLSFTFFIFFKYRLTFLSCTISHRISPLFLIHSSITQVSSFFLVSPASDIRHYSWSVFLGYGSFYDYFGYLSSCMVWGGFLEVGNIVTIFQMIYWDCCQMLPFRSLFHWARVGAIIIMLLPLKFRLLFLLASFLNYPQSH